MHRNLGLRDVYFIFSLFCPPHSEVFSCWVSFVLNILGFHSTTRICVEFVLYSNLPSCSKTYFAQPSPFRLQNHRPPVAKQLFLLPFACLTVDQNKCHFALKASECHSPRFLLKPEVTFYPYCDWSESNRNPDSFVLNSPCDWQKNVGWPRLNSLHCKCSAPEQNCFYKWHRHVRFLISKSWNFFSKVGNT